MNSHQRRKDRKKWRHEVLVAVNTTEDYTWGWDRYIEIWDWCVAQWGKDADTCGWRESHSKRNVWQFDCPKKATLFALRWSS